MEGGGCLIVVGTLLQVIPFHLTRGDVAVINPDPTILRPLIVDMVVVDECLGAHTGGIGKHLVTVETILISPDLSGKHQLKQIGEEVHLRTHWLHRIIESCIGILVQVDLTVDISPPHHILRHRLCRGERDLGTGGERLAIRPLLLCLLTA